MVPTNHTGSWPDYRVRTDIWLWFSRLFQDKITSFSRLFKAFCSSLSEHKHYKIRFQTLKFSIQCILLFQIPNGTQTFNSELQMLCVMNCNKINKCMGNQQCNRHLHFTGQPYSFQGFFQTFPYRWSFSRLFKALKISTLNSRTFHTFPAGSVRTL